MRQSIKMPRILKINWIRELSISVVFNNGESRIIDFRKVLKMINVEKNSPAFILFDSKEFAKVELIDNTLSWNNIEQYITGTMITLTTGQRAIFRALRNKAG